jgi:hypothetical protein
VLRQLEDLYRRLATYRSSAEVNDSLNGLHDELSERRWMTKWLPL